MQEGSSVIVFMDMQSRLLHSIEHADELIESCSILAACSKLLQIPSVLTEQVPEKLGSSDKQIVSRLGNPYKVSKDTFSAFGSSEFCDLLTPSCTKRIVLVGIETPICILLTALDALKAGFSVTLLSDCVSCRVLQGWRTLPFPTPSVRSGSYPIGKFYFSRTSMFCSS